MIVHRTPTLLKRIFPAGFEWTGPTHTGADTGTAPQPVLYLTFDDGPIPEETDFVLDTLAGTQTTGTFFCVGDNVRKHPDIYQRVLAQGHQVGNHTFNHLKGWQTPLPQYLANIESCHEVMMQHAPQAHLPQVQQHNKVLFRPPYGRITFKQAKRLPARYRVIMWDVLTADYEQNLMPEKCLKNAVKATRPGAIVVFHDSVKSSRNLRYVLPRYIAHFKELGYQFGQL